MTKPLANTTAQPRVFTFGEPERITNRRQLFDYGISHFNGRWWEPVIDMKTLASLLHDTPYHESAIDAWINILAGTLIPTKAKYQGKRVLKKRTLLKLLKDYRTFGNFYAFLRRNRAGKIIEVEHLPALYMRRGKEEHEFYYLHQEKATYLLEEPDWTYYDHDVVHLKRYDVRQEIYGVPSYLGALDSAWLNKEATLLKRRFMVNGAHLGFVFVLNSAELPDEDVDGIEDALSSAKGDFGNLFVHLPGEEDGSIKIHPIGDIATKDDYWHVKISSRNDVLAQHRVPLILMSIMPENTSGLGKPQDAAAVFAKNEVLPFHDELDEELNDAAEITLLKFSAYSLGVSTSDEGDTTKSDNK